MSTPDFDLTPEQLQSLEETVEGLRGAPDLYTSVDFAAGRMPTPEERERGEKIRAAAPLALSAGVPVEWAAEHPEEADKLARGTEDDVANIAVRHPELAKWAMKNMGLVGDRLHELSGLSWLFAASREAWKSGRKETELGMLRAKELMGQATASDKARIDLLKFDMELEGQRDFGAESWVGKRWTDFVKMAPMTWSAMEYAIVGSGVGYGIGFTLAATGAAAFTAVVGPEAAPAIPAAGHEMGLLFARWGGRIGAFASSAAIEGGLMYDELLDMGADKNTARWIAIPVGVINGGLEMVELEGLLHLAAGSRFFMRDATRRAEKAAEKEILSQLAKGEKVSLADPVARRVFKDMMARQTTRRRLIQLGQRWGMAAISETATEVVQEFTNIVGDHIAAHMQDDVEAGNFAQDLRRLAEIANVTFGSMLVGGWVFAGSGFVVDTARAKANAKQVADLEQKIRLIEGIDLGKKNGNIIEEVVKALKEDMPFETVYVDREAWDTYWQEKGEDPAAKAREITGNPEAYDEAQETGDVAIPIEKYVAKFTGTEHHVELMEHIRAHPGSATIHEAKQLTADEKAAQAKIAEDEAAKAELTDRMRIEKQVADQLVAAGLSESAARTNAAIISAFFEAFSQRVGKTAWELWTAFGAAPQGRVRIVVTMPEVARTGGPRALTPEEAAAEAIRKDRAQEFTNLKKKAAEGSLTDEEAERLRNLQEEFEPGFATAETEEGAPSGEEAYIPPADDELYTQEKEDGGKAAKTQGPAKGQGPATTQGAAKGTGPSPANRTSTGQRQTQGVRGPVGGGVQPAAQQPGPASATTGRVVGKAKGPVGTRLRVRGPQAVRNGQVAFKMPDPPVEADGMIHVVHWGRTAREEMDPAYYGGGKPGHEAARRDQYRNYWVNRTYYGLAGYAEAGVGYKKHVAKLDPRYYYDWDRDPLEVMKRATHLAWEQHKSADDRLIVTIAERLLEDEGWHGYYSRRNAVLVSYKKVAVEYVGEGDSTQKFIPDIRQQVKQGIFHAQPPEQKWVGNHIVGAPTSLKGETKEQTQTNLEALRAKLMDMARRGEAARFWYERSAFAILHALGGDLERTRKLIALIAIYSARADVRTNIAWALRAFRDLEAGREISFWAVNGEKQRLEAMEAYRTSGASITTQKRRSFFNNLLAPIDPTVEIDQSTIDRHIMRAFGYGNEAPSDTQYHFAQREIEYLAAKLGWTPMQVQAAIWATQLYENKKSELLKKGKKEEAAALREEDFSGYDYSTALTEAAAQIAWESEPGANTGLLEDLRQAPQSTKLELRNALMYLLHDDDGRAIALRAMDLTVGSTFDGWGVFEGAVTPGGQQEAVLGALPSSGPDTADVSARLDAAAAIEGIILRQKAMAWSIPTTDWVYDSKTGRYVKQKISAKDKNLFWLELSRDLRQNEVEALSAAVEKEVGSAIIADPSGFRILNISDVPNDKYGRKLRAILKKALPADVAWNVKPGCALSNYFENDWTKTYDKLSDEEKAVVEKYMAYVREERLDDEQKKAFRDRLASAVDYLAIISRAGDKYIRRAIRVIAALDPRAIRIRQDIAGKYGKAGDPIFGRRYHGLLKPMKDAPTYPLSERPPHLDSVNAGPSARIMSSAVTENDDFFLQEKEIGGTPAAEEDPRNNPAFREWFGDSKVVDEFGRPLVVWHGSPVPWFRVFSRKRGGENTGAMSGKGAFWFAEEPEHSADYVYLREREEYWATSPPWRFVLDRFTSISDWMQIHAEEIERIAEHDQKVAEALKDFREWALENVAGMWPPNRNKGGGPSLLELLERAADGYVDFIHDSADYMDIETGQPIRRGDTRPMLFGIASAPYEMAKIAEALKSHEDKLDIMRGAGELVPGDLTKAADDIAEAFEPLDLEELQKSGHLRAFYLRIENPYIVEGARWGDGSFPRGIAEARAGGHDGAIYRNLVDGPQVGTHYVVFSPNQIKAVDNVGTFRRDTDDIYLQEKEVPGEIEVSKRDATVSVAVAEQVLDGLSPGDAGMYSTVIRALLNMRFKKMPWVDLLRRLSKDKNVKQREFVEMGLDVALQEEERRLAEGQKPEKITMQEALVRLQRRRLKLKEHHIATSDVAAAISSDDEEYAERVAPFVRLEDRISTPQDLAYAWHEIDWDNENGVWGNAPEADAVRENISASADRGFSALLNAQGTWIYTNALDKAVFEALYDIRDAADNHATASAMIVRALFGNVVSEWGASEKGKLGNDLRHHIAQSIEEAIDNADRYELSYDTEMFVELANAVRDCSETRSVVDIASHMLWMGSDGVAEPQGGWKAVQRRIWEALDEGGDSYEIAEAVMEVVGDELHKAVSSLARRGIGERLLSALGAYSSLHNLPEDIAFLWAQQNWHNIQQGDYTLITRFDDEYGGGPSRVRAMMESEPPSGIEAGGRITLYGEYSTAEEFGDRLKSFLGWEPSGYGELLYEVVEPFTDEYEPGPLTRDVESASRKHWDELNEENDVPVNEMRLLFHVRYTTYTTNDGRDIFFIEELQSDAHSEARKIFARRGEHLTDEQIDERIGPWLRMRRNAWAAAAMRRAIMLAAKAQYDEVVWTASEQQAIRWTDALRGAVDKLEWRTPVEEIQSERELLLWTERNNRTWQWDSPLSAFKKENLDETNRAAVAEVFRVLKENPDARVAILTVHMKGRGDATPFLFVEGFNAANVIGDENMHRWPQMYPIQPASVMSDYTGGEIAKRVMEERVGVVSGKGIILGTKGYAMVYDKAAKDAAAKLAKRYSNPKPVKERLQVGSVDEGLYVWRMPITEDMQKVVSDGVPLYQKKKTKVAGYTRRTGQHTFDIGILKGHDLSTFVHEFAHFAFEFMGDLVESGEANEQIKKDYETLLKFAGVTSREEMRQKIAELKARREKGELTPEEFNRLHPHERIARAFEVYLSEGRAPAPELQGVFSRIKMWMLKVYGEAKKKLGIEINDEIRSVFDRWLATDEAIARAKEESELGALARFASLVGGMSEEEARRYHKLVEEAEESARREVAQEVMADIKREAQRRRKQVEEEVSVEATRKFYLENRAYAAIYYLQNGKMPPGYEDKEPEERLTLSKDAIVNSYGADMLARLPRPAVYRREGGVHPDEVAPLFGFASGHELLEAMANVPAPRGQAVKMAVEKAVKAKLEEEGIHTPTDEELAEKAQEALNGDATGRVFLAQLRRLGRLVGRQVTPRKVLRENAERIVRNQRVADLRPQAYLQARQRATRDMMTAIAKQDWEKAWEAAERQVRLHELYMAAKKARDRALQIRRRMQNAMKPSAIQRLGKAGAEYVDQLVALLERFDFIKLSQKALQRRVNLRAWLEEQHREGKDVVVPEKLQDEAFRKNWQELTVEELEGLDVAVQSILNQGRLKRKLKLWKQEMDEDSLAAILLKEIEANLKDLGGQPFDPNTQKALERIVQQGKIVDAALKKVEAIFDLFDGKQEGPWHQLLFQTISAAEKRENDMMEAFAEKLVQIAQLLPKEARQRMMTQVHIASLKQDVTISWIIGIALNTGNESNFRKMMEGGYYDLSGQRVTFTMEQIEEMLGHLTAEEWRFVQAIWDAVEDFWPEIEALERRLTGVAPKKIERRPPPLKLPNMPKGIRGGYWPVAYDSRSIAGHKQQSDDEARQYLFEAGYARAATPHGWTNERVENYARPLTFNWEWILQRHVSQVIHDLTHREAVLSVWRILKREDVMAAIKSRAGEPAYNALIGWIRYVANERVFRDEENAMWWWSFMNKARGNVTVAVMGFKVTTLLSQIAGIFNSLEMVPERFMVRAIIALSRDFSAQVQFMMDNSTEMKHRAKTFERDIRDMIRAQQISVKTATKGIRRAAMAGIGYMDLIVTVPTWHAAYMQEMEKSGDHDKAVAYADKVVRLTQGAGGAKDLSPVQRARYLKMVTMFYSYFAALYSRGASWLGDAPEIVRRRAWNELPRWLMRGFYVWIIPAIVAELLAGRPPDRDRDKSWASWAAAKVFSYPLLVFPIIRDFAAMAESFVTGEKPSFGYRFTPIQTIGEAISRAVSKMVAVAQGDAEIDEALPAVAEAAGYATGMPTAQVKGTAKMLYEYGVGERESDWWGQFIYEVMYGREMPEPAPLVAEE